MRARARVSAVHEPTRLPPARDPSLYTARPPARPPASPLRPQVVAQLKATIDARLMSLTDDDEDDDDHLGDDGEDVHPQRFGASGGTAGGGGDDETAMLDATDDVDTTVSRAHRAARRWRWPPVAALPLL